MFEKLRHFLPIFLFITSLFPHLEATQNRQIKVIVFDFGGVIAKTDKQQVAHFIAEMLHLSESEAFHALAELKIYTNHEKKEEDFWTEYATIKEIVLPTDWMEKLAEARLRALRPIPGMVALVKVLQEQGYQTALLSNVRKSQAEIKRKLGYYELFNPLLLSYDIGAKKPNREAYELLLNELKVPPEAVLFIDNKLQNVLAARDLQIDAVLFLNADQLIQELKNRGINPPLPHRAQEGFSIEACTKLKTS